MPKGQRLIVVELRRHAGGCYRIQEGFKLAVRAILELDFVFGADAAERTIAGGAVLIRVQIDCRTGAETASAEFVASMPMVCSLASVASLRSAP